jgi:hypothetical protein
MNPQPLFVDFEASGLGPASYPIEVAFSAPRGGEPVGYLIDPQRAPGWRDWGRHDPADRIAALTTLKERACNTPQERPPNR